MESPKFLTLEDLQVGKFYERNDDALYYVVAKGKDWFLTITYSYNHKVACPVYHHESFLSEDYNEDLKEVAEWKEDICKIIMDGLVYSDDFTLTLND